jgi:hypothetical protein
MTYLIHLKKGSSRAHIWDKHRQDTRCRMSNADGFDKENYLISDDNFGKRMCKNCLGINKHSK